MVPTPKRAAREAESSTALRAVARGGFAANGVVHILIGAIAFAVAFGGGGESDQSGALKAIEDIPGGVFVLWLLALGLCALGFWYIVEGIVARGDTSTKWKKRVASWGRAVAYLFLGGIAVSVALGGNPDSEESTESTTSGILQLPGGVFIVAAGGLVVIGIGVYFVVKGASQKFRENLDLPSGGVGNAVSALGTVGYIAKGVALGVIGVLLIIAAVTLDPETAGGFDGAIKSLLELPFGVWLVAIVGAGLIAYGVFQFFRARYAKL